MPIELKICGINSENIIREILKIGGCSYLGFVFYPPSPRNLSIKQSLKLTSIVPNNIKKELFDLAQQYGAKKASVSLANSTSFQVDVREQKIESLQESGSSGVHLTVSKN